MMANDNALGMETELSLGIGLEGPVDVFFFPLILLSFENMNWVGWDSSFYNAERALLQKKFANL
jgi:hypothetical protein